MTKYFRVGFKGEDIIVIAQSASDAISKANEVNAKLFEAGIARCGKANKPRTYNVATEIILIDGVELR